LLKENAATGLTVPRPVKKKGIGPGKNEEGHRNVHPHSLGNFPDLARRLNKDQRKENKGHRTVGGGGGWRKDSS